MRWEYSDQQERNAVLSAYERALMEALNSGRDCDVVVEVRSRDGNAVVEHATVRYLNPPTPPKTKYETGPTPKRRNRKDPSRETAFQIRQALQRTINGQL